MNRPNRATARNVGRKTSKTIKKVVAIVFLATVLLCALAFSVVTSIIHSASC